MKKKIAKLLALGMSIALVFSLAACADDTNPDVPETTTEQVTTTEPQAEPATGESESVSESESESGEQPSSEAPEAQGITNPGSDVNAAVTLYNDALAKANFSTANIQRTWGGSDTTVGDLNKISNGGVKPLFEEAATKSVTPASLNASSVSSVSSSESGNSITMTFTLKDASGDASAKYGDFGYPYFITYADAKELVDAIGGALNVSVVLKDSCTLKLSNGKITATVDKTSGTMTALSTTFDETVDGSATAMKVVPVPKAIIWGTGNVTFS